MAIKFLNNVAVDSDVLYVDAINNRVGIGTTSPSYKLHVVGNSYIDANSSSANLTLGRYSGQPSIKAGTDDGGYLIMDSTGGRAALNWYSSDSVVLVNGGGNVGIGATTPSEKLEVSGSIKSGNLKIQNANGGRIGLNRNTATGAIYNNSYGAFQIQNNGGGVFEIQSYNSSGASTGVLSMLESNGNVGIGTTSPTRLFHVAGASASAIITLQRTNGNSSGSYGALQWTASDDHTVAVIDARADGDNEGAHLLFHTTSAAASNDPYGINERMRITSAGNVGIGTTSPIDKLQIDAPNSQLRLRDTDDGTFTQFSSSGNKLAIRQNSTSANHIWLTSSGDVGIGESDPSGYWGQASNLVLNDSNTGLTIKSTTTGNGRVVFTDTKSSTSGLSDGGMIHYDHSGDSMRFHANGSERMRIDSSGNVGIGTTSPTEKLTVSGNAFITNNIYAGSGNTLKSCTYPARYSLAVGRNNILGGNSCGIIGTGNTIACTAEPWSDFGGNFIAGKNNTINNQYTHANAVFGQANTLGNGANTSNNVANSLIAGSEHTLFSNNALVYGFSCFASSSQHSLTGGYDSNNFASYGSIAIGSGATASAGLGQFALGTGITTPTTVSAAYGPDQFVVGKFNEYTNASSVPHRFAVGNGTSDAARDTPFCVVGGGTYTNGQVSINDADGFAYTTVPYSVFHVNGRATSSYSSTFTVTSDERLKDNILDYDKGLAEILQVKPKSYTFNGKANTVEGVESIGVLAQEIKDVFPETIGTVNKRLNPTDEEETELYTVDISPVTYALINAIKELNAKIEALENRIQILEGN